MSGVGVSTFHPCCGLFFTRNADDTVRVRKTFNGLAIQQDGMNVVVDVTLDRNTWDSLVRCMAPGHTFRDDAAAARAAQAVHETVRS